MKYTLIVSLTTIHSVKIRLAEDVFIDQILTQVDERIAMFSPLY